MSNIEDKTKRNKNQETEIKKEFNSIISHLRQSERDISERKICQLEGINRKTFRKIKKKFKLNPKKMKRFLKNQNGRKFLILDYVIITKDMQIIDRPFNYIYNYVSGKMQPCLVLLFGAIQIDENIYPIDFSYWISNIMLEDGEIYLSKIDIALKMIEKIIENCIEFDGILFDAGFCSPKLLEFINSKSIKYYCRFPQNRNILVQGIKSNSREIFKTDYNGSFHYDPWLEHFTKNTFGLYAKHNIQLIVVADCKQKLLDRDFYCILTNDIENKYTQCLRIYKLRGKVEYLFKKLKSYLGICSFNSHNQNRISNHIQFCVSGYILCEELSKKLKNTFFQTLQYIKMAPKEKIYELIFPIWEEVSVFMVNITIEERIAA
jgi:hypothetical protein